ncbi:MAG: hypothetical protein M1819_005909 [Sarea resinae]|nr:MAG: hypothetical protein M1819_005909 [Sarea resinae]
MCRGPLHSFLARLPKCEHHIHIEGSLSHHLLFELAARNKITLPSPQSDPAFASPSALLERYNAFTSLDDFLHYYYIGMAVLIHASDFEDLAYAYLCRANADGVMHAEIFFDPQAHTSRGVAYNDVVNGLTRGCKRAQEDLGITTKLILCILRHLPVHSGLDTFDAALLHFQNGHVSGIGLDSSEKDFPPKLFEPIYTSAKKSGLRLTAHAGEEGDASYVRDALDILGVERIDHGVRLVEDPDLMKRVAASKTLLTVCPLSNQRLGVVKAVKDLPLRKMLDAGVRFSINSDDPAYFGGYILDNYCAVQDAFDLSVDEWRGIAIASIEGSWCSEERKSVMLERLEEVVRMFRKEQ